MTPRAIAACAVCLLALAVSPAAQDAKPWIVYDGFDGPGKGKHVVLVSGDEEYRSEEMLPQLAKILAKHHGFKCTALFAIDKDGTINPNRSDIPGLEALKTADLVVMFLRFRNLPDEQMAHLVEYIESGRPIVGIRTSTHAFNIPKGRKYDTYSWQIKEWQGGFGRKVLGETWISHHGNHGTQATRGFIAFGQEKNPIVRGIKDGDVFGPTDVYGVRLPLPEGCEPVVMGQVVAGMKPTDPPLIGKKNEPMMPIAWTRSYKGTAGKEARVFTSTMGASQDFESEGFRRLMVNGCYWALGMERQIPERSNVELVGEYTASPFKNNGFKKGVRPADLTIK